MKTKKSEIFTNEEKAWMWAMTAQTIFMSGRFHTVTTFSPAANRVEITVHFNLPHFPKLPSCCHYTEMSYSSFEYYSLPLKRVIRCRTLNLVYKW